MKIVYVGPDLVETEVEKSTHKTIRGLQLRLLELAEQRFGPNNFKTIVDGSLVGFYCSDSEGNCLGLAMGSEIGVL